MHLMTFLTVKPNDLKFELEDRVFSHSNNDGSSMQGNFFQRWLARQVACSILNDESDTYQFGGYTGAKKLSYEMVDAHKEQLAHWILRRVGYKCCPADLMELTGRSEQELK